MSFQSWHNYGYGICTDDIKEHSVSRFLRPRFLSARSRINCPVRLSPISNGMTIWHMTQIMSWALPQS